MENYSKSIFDEWTELKLSESFNSIENDSTNLKLLFASDTYYAFIVKALAGLILENNPEAVMNITPEQIEDRHFFEKKNVENFIESNLLDWYIYEDYDKEAAADVIRLLRHFINKYISSDEDMLKIIHQAILPKYNRYRTGEFYTPDWLADFALEASGYGGAMNETVLDPCCGSGSFLFFAVRKILSANPYEKLNPELILKNINGYDLNPLAILATKANLLIALKKFIPFQSKINFNIEKKDLFDAGEEKKTGSFDFILGNPPWLNWKSLNEKYKEKIVPVARTYSLFIQKGLKARLGFAEDDISSIITYISIDRYLKDSGRLAFILPQSLFQSIGGGEGFRQFYLSNSGTDISVERVVDFVKVNPFKMASNRAALLIVQKGKKNIYPVKYDIFGNSGNGLNVFKDLNEFNEKSTLMPGFAEPVNESDKCSPWILTPDKRLLKIIRGIMAASDYQARAGVCTWLSGVYWVDILQREKEYFRVSNNPANGKIKVKMIMRNVDSVLVYPLLRGRDVKRWHSEFSGNIIFAQDFQKPVKAIPEEIMKSRYKLTYDYFCEFKDILCGRKGYKKFLSRQPFYAMYDSGLYTIAKYKVGWKYLSKDMDAAVIHDMNENIIIPDLNVITIAASSLTEAYYISALLNSSIVKIIIRTYGECLRITPGIMKQLPIPRFVENEHFRLAELAENSHQCYKDKIQIRKNEEEIDNIYASLLGITKDNLNRIKDYINENQ